MINPLPRRCFADRGRFRNWRGRDTCPVSSSLGWATEHLNTALSNFNEDHRICLYPQWTAIADSDTSYCQSCGSTTHQVPKLYEQLSHCAWLLCRRCSLPEWPNLSHYSAIQLSIMLPKVEWSTSCLIWFLLLTSLSLTHVRFHFTIWVIFGFLHFIF